MDKRLWFCLWVVGGTCFLGVLGALFGAIAGALARMSGSAPGGILGHRVLAAYEKVADRELTPAQCGAVVGAADGAFFLGMVGAILGLLAGANERFSNSTLLGLFLLIAALIVLALHFGLLAYGMSRAGFRAFAGASTGGVLGAVTGAAFGGLLGFFAGVEVGVVAGLAYALWTRSAERGPVDLERWATHHRQALADDGPADSESIRTGWDKFRPKEREP